MAAMPAKPCLVLGFVLTLMLLERFPSVPAQQTSSPAAAPATTASTAKESAVAPDLAARLAKFRRVPMPFHATGLTAREQQMVGKLVEASQYLEDIYWRQSDPQGLALLQSLAGSSKPADVALRRYLTINGNRFDLIRDNEPFVGSAPMPPGHGLYPPGLTRDQMEAYVRRHPEQKSALYDPHTIVQRNGSQLVAVPYHLAYRAWLEPEARALVEALPRSATMRSSRISCAYALRALLDDDYYPSDLAWLDLASPKFDVIFAPYEVYLDNLLGVKTSYGAAVMIRNEEESSKLAVFQKYVPAIQDALPLGSARIVPRKSDTNLRWK